MNDETHQPKQGKLWSPYQEISGQNKCRCPRSVLYVGKEENKTTRARTRRVQDEVEDDHDQSSPNTQHGVEKSREMRDRPVEGPRAQFRSS